jgi:alanyl-tRNA synthetase
LTTDEFDVPQRVASLKGELRELRARLERAEVELRGYLVRKWTSETAGGGFVRDVGPGRSDWLAPMASTLADERGEPVLLTSEENDGVRLALAAPHGHVTRAGKILKLLLEAGGGRGGGSDRLAQGKVGRHGLRRLLEIWRERGGE